MGALEPVIVKLYMGNLNKEKGDIVAALGRQSHPGTSTFNVTLGSDKGIEKKQLNRFLSDQIRHHAAVERLLGV